MTFQPGVSLADDAEAVMDAAEALTEGNLEATDAFDRASQVIGAMLDRSDEVVAEAEAAGEGEAARESAAILEVMHDGLTALSEGEEPDDLDEVTEHVRGLASAYAMRLLEAQLAQALGVQ